MTATHYLRPPWAARVIGGRMARLFKPRVVSLLSVPGRTTDTWRSTPVAVLGHEGHEYLMAAYGDTEWSRNLRASGSGRLTRGGATEEFTAEEVPAGELPGLVQEYLRQFGTMPNVTRTFEALPDPADHPAFRITVTGRGPRRRP
ncbi:deazaflavin-dependent oxidoreductase, nitroreductase family [Actinacidiphila rubida]|uniref:Deazaflavin-dependent oxidoreductase, nitroreductase family n=1 Tax=Actinacidiphila rubida TaxID=310780 RepID=A0A1H8GDJ7_9ACTN|nr:nitroreductase/quinone reductase family protein [Actinacidiphila rubida]SEN41889.1 deazaflavin-dependent oxidoreductase, nitroreductase family [Actinacidiphila rubida]